MTFSLREIISILDEASEVNNRFLESEQNNRAYDSPVVTQCEGMILEDRLLKARFARHANSKIAMEA